MCHNSDVTMGAIAFQITSLTTVYSTVYSNADQRKHQSSASLAFMRGIHRSPVAQMDNNAEIVSVWWRHHVYIVNDEGIPAVLDEGALYIFPTHRLVLDSFRIWSNLNFYERTGASRNL